MSYYVVMERLCGCARERRQEQIRTFGTKEEAEAHAHEWAEALNSDYCGRHGFDVVAVNDHYVISVEQGGFVESCELS